ncbi:MAG: enoyl-CoA hydratase [Planctomycetota bacterium]|nr:MAG: enoyl-CoA hydratase [Planctomycetota bacterium]
MAEYENILVEVEDGVATVTVNRPKALNALNRKTMEELAAVFNRVREDASITGVILTGAGEKAFVAGADIGEIHELNGKMGLAFAEFGQGVLNLIENCGKPVIACVNGFALGGGCEISMACTFRYATVKAKFGQPEVNLGVIPGYGGTQRLARLVGEGRAMEMCLSGNHINADEAHRIGLVNTLFDDAEAMLAAARDTLKLIAKKGPEAIRLCIEALHQGLSLPLADGLALEADRFAQACATEDMKEGTKAFLEKRKPEFKGK